MWHIAIDEELRSVRIKDVRAVVVPRAEPVSAQASGNKRRCNLAKERSKPKRSEGIDRVIFL
jgi:hypothetical protein